MPVDVETIGEQLRAKIASKFQLTGTLAGLCFTTLSIELTLLHADHVPGLLPPSIGLMFSSMCLFFVSLYRLDGLTMPKRFWDRSDHPGPPGDNSWSLTDDNLWALKDRMLFLWKRLSLVAIALTGAALSLLIVPAKATPSDALQATFWWASACVAATAIYCGGLYCWERQKERSDGRFGKLLRFVD